MLDDASLADLKAAFRTLTKNGIDPADDNVKELLRRIDKAQYEAYKLKRITAQLAVGKGPTVGEAASGGPASGLTWVGEEGPELVNLPPGSYVHDNAESMRMASVPTGGGVVATREIHVHIDQGAYIDGPSIDRLTNLIAQRLNYATGL